MSGKPKKRHPVTQPLDKPYRFIPLTQGQNAIVDASDFSQLSQRNWFAHWSPRTHSFYAESKINGTHRQMHAVILACRIGEWGDHKNHNTLDNRRENLRKCNPSKNAQNRKRPTTNSSGFKGVSWHSNGKWYASIKTDRKRSLGFFKSVDEAAHAYDEAAKEHFGEFAHLNFP